MYVKRNKECFPSLYVEGICWSIRRNQKLVVLDSEMNDMGEACYVLGLGINKNQLKNSEVCPKRITLKRSLSYFK